MSFTRRSTPGADDWVRCGATPTPSARATCCTTAGRPRASCSARPARSTPYQGQRPLTESDPPGVPLRPNYSLLQNRRRDPPAPGSPSPYRLPLTIIRIRSTYGPEGGAPADRSRDAVGAASRSGFIQMRRTTTTRSTRTTTSNSVFAQWKSRTPPPIVVNWAGSETVSVEDYCAFLGQLVACEPVFEYSPQAHTPCGPIVTLHAPRYSGRTEVSWKRRISSGWSQAATPSSYSSASRGEMTNVSFPGLRPTQVHRGP